MANEKNLKPFKKGDDVRRNLVGRPRKYVTLLKDSGYKLSEINDTIQAMLQMSIEELKEIWQDANATILEKTIANAMMTSLKRGSLYSIDTLLNRVYGKPKEMVQTMNEGKIEIVYIEGKTIL